MLKCFLAVSMSSTALAQPTLFDNVRVFDGERGIGVHDVLVRDGRIERVVRTVEPEDGWEIVDGAGHTLLPGMIDAHTHTWSLDQLEAAADLGVTTVLDMFTSPDLARVMRRSTEGAGGHEYADLKSSMTLLTAAGGHGTQFGTVIPTVATVDEVAEFVRVRFEDEGADYLKIVCEDGSAFGVEFNPISEQVLFAAVEAAHERGKLAVVHVSTQEWAERAVAANADALVHIFADVAADAAWIEQAAESGIAVVPTLSVIASVSNSDEWRSVAEDDRLASYLKPDQLGGLARAFGARQPEPETLERGIATVRALHAAGVKILAGTDAPNPGTAHGASMHQELVLLARAGLSNAEVLAAATSVPADVFKLHDRGMIEPGRRADLLLVRGNPEENLDHTRDIVGVWRGGVANERAVNGVVVAQNLENDDARDGRLGLVSNFDAGELDAALGIGWSVSTDAMMGGTSSATLTVIDGGAAESAGALRVQGNVTEDVANPWAGAQFSPGEQMFAAADLSQAEGLRFRARGDGRGYAIVVFTQSRGFQPVFAVFQPGNGTWSEHAFSWRELGGIDGSDITAIVISASTPAGDFKLDLDEWMIE